MRDGYQFGEKDVLTTGEVARICNVASRTVSNVPLGLLASGRYRLEAAHAMRLGDELSFSLSTADGESRATAVLSSKGLKSLIELPRGVRPASRLVSGG